MRSTSRLGFVSAWSLVACACAGVSNDGPHGDAAAAGAGAGATTASGAGGGAGDGGAEDERVWCDESSRVLWAKQLGDPASQRARAIASDGDGGVFVAGIFSGKMDLGGPGDFIALGGLDIFVAHFDAEGKVIWRRQLGDGGGGVLAMARSNDGGVLLSGEFRKEVDFGDGMPLAPAGFADGFVARYDAKGGHVWHRVVSGPSSMHSELCKQVAVDADDSIYVGIIFAESIDDFAGESVTSAGQKDVLLVKLDGAGQTQWQHRFGDAQDDVVNSVFVDANTVVLGGGSNGTVDLGDGALAPTTSWDALVGTYDVQGNAIWTRRFGGPGVQNVSFVAVDATSKDVLLTGGLTSAGETDFGGGPISSDHGGYVARLDDGGSHVASMSFDGLTNPTALVVDPDGDILVTGPFEDEVDLGGGPIAAIGKTDGILAKLDPQLGHLWTLQVGSIEDDAIAGVAEDFVLADFQETIDIPGCPTFTSRGSSDVLLIKLKP